LIIAQPRETLVAFRVIARRSATRAELDDRVLVHSSLEEKRITVLLAQVTTSSVPTTTTSVAPAVTHLTNNNWNLALWLTVGLVIAAGIVVTVGRTVLEGRGASDRSASHASAPDRTLMRSWLAISLAGGLLLFCAVSFGIDDTTLRSTLIGGLVANAGAAVAFYFASKSSDQARRDILNASTPTVLVPNLNGKNPSEVNAALAVMPLHLNSQPPTPDPAAIAFDQSPAANQPTPQGSQITVSFAGPVPDLQALKPAEVAAALEKVNLKLQATPSSPPGESTVTTPTDPVAGRPAPPDRTVKVTFTP
jgi:hypothetical protein